MPSALCILSPNCHCVFLYFFLQLFLDLPFLHYFLLKTTTTKPTFLQMYILKKRTNKADSCTCSGWAHLPSACFDPRNCSRLHCGSASLSCSCPAASCVEPPTASMPGWRNTPLGVELGKPGESPEGLIWMHVLSPHKSAEVTAAEGRGHRDQQIQVGLTPFPALLLLSISLLTQLWTLLVTFLLLSTVSEP